MLQGVQVRRGEHQQPARPQHPLDRHQGRQRISQVLDHVEHAHDVELAQLRRRALQRAGVDLQAKIAPELVGPGLVRLQPGDLAAVDSRGTASTALADPGRVFQGR